MLKFESFTGINNVSPSHRLKNSELTVAANIDIGLRGELKRRSGYTQVLGTCHKNLWQADGFMLATVDGNDLVAIAPNGDRTTVQAALGPARVWYCNLPDGATAFSNGSINGLTAGAAATAWGVADPASSGALTEVAGSLYPGTYMYSLTHVRLSDGRESAPLVSIPYNLTTGGITLTGLPTRAGHKTNVYLTSHNGDQALLAGSTTNSVFAFTAAHDTLVLPCRTDNLMPAPVGTVLAFWRGRALVAVGPTLYASLPGQWEMFDPRRDFKQFSADITAVQPTDEGMFIGTEKELAYLDGSEFDKLVYSRVVSGPVVLGSGVAVRGELIKQGDGMGDGEAMICIADHGIVAGFSSGKVERLTEGVYSTSVTEVFATFRKVNDVPQYIAIPQ